MQIPTPAHTTTMLYGVTDIYSYLIGTILIVLLPGPNSLYVMTLASRYGVRVGYRGACGIFAGDTVLMLLAASGAASLLAASPNLFAIIKTIGAAYLAWLGLGLLRGAIQQWRTPTHAPAKLASADARKPFRTAFVISVLNPKAILFFVSFFVQFVDPNYPHPALSFLILGMLVQVCSAAYLSALIFGGNRLADQFRQRRRSASSATAMVGILFIGFALKLASANLS